MMSRDVEPPFIQNERSRQASFLADISASDRGEIQFVSFAGGADGLRRGRAEAASAHPANAKHHVAACEPPSWRSTPTEGEMPKCRKAFDWQSRIGKPLVAIRDVPAEHGNIADHPAR
jgi:hypothetical protein